MAPAQQQLSDSSDGEAPNQPCLQDTHGDGTPILVPGIGLVVSGKMLIGEAGKPLEEITFHYIIFPNGAVFGTGNESDPEVLPKPGRPTAGITGQARLVQTPGGGLSLAALTLMVWEQPINEP